MPKEWRDRYLQLADEHEQLSAAHKAAERELTRLITRLCVAASGLDPTLDPPLDRLRAAAKGGRLDTLVRQAGELSESLAGVAGASRDRRRSDPLARLLERGSLGRRELAEAQSLWATLAAGPADAADAPLDRLAELLQAALGSAAAVPATGLWARIVGRGTGEPPNRLLLDLLQAMPWPEGLDGEVAGFREQLDNDEKGDAWVEVVRGISDLAVQAIGQAQHDARAAQRFLTTLNERLAALDQHMLEEIRRRRDSQDSGDRLGHQMHSEVSSLSDKVRRSVDLAELQEQVLGSLDRMHAHVTTHLAGESVRRTEAEAEAGELRDRLRQLETEAFDLRRQVATTQQQAMRDPLTGLPNRRAYDERIAQEYARWKRFGDPLTLLVLDVDDFKQVNDTFGHGSGDKALVMIARILTARLRETDFIARFGGEEFVVMAVGADTENALHLADSLRVAVEDGGLHAGSQPVQITVSGGLAEFDEGDTPETVFERADQALYQAKGSGKNRIVTG